MYLEIQGAKTRLASVLSTATECNVIPLADFAYLFPSKVMSNGLPKPGVVEPNAAVLQSYASNIDHYGTINLKVIYKGKIIPLECFVIKNGSYSIIGSPAMFKMGVEISFRGPFGGIM